MFRRSLSRMGHQLIHEPMGGEHDTLSRGTRTVGKLSQFVISYSGVAAAGVVALGYIVASTPDPIVTVGANGSVVKK